MTAENLNWHNCRTLATQEGQAVGQFDRVCEVQSDKATIEITSRWG